MSEKVPQSQYQQIHEIFKRQMASTLQLSPEEQELCSGVKPETWALWGLSVLAGDERVAYPFKEHAHHWGSPQGLSFIAAEAVAQGQPALDFKTSPLAQKVNEMHTSHNPAKRQRFQDFGELLGKFAFTTAGTMGITSAEWTQYVPLEPQVALAADLKDNAPRIVFGGQDAQPIRLEGPLDRVIAFGPGLTAAVFVAAAMTISKEVHLVSPEREAPFINTYADLGLQSSALGIAQYRRQRPPKGLAPNVDHRTLQLPQAIKHANGIDAAMCTFGKKERVDAVTMTSVHTAGVVECSAGVSGAAKRLRQGGYFILKAPDISLGAEAGMDKIFPLAQKLLGNPIYAGACGELQQTHDASLPLERSASFAVFQKQ